VDLLVTQPTAEAGHEALGAYLAQWAELAGRLRSIGTPSGVELDLQVGGSAAGIDGDGGGWAEVGGGWAAGRRLGLLPAAAPHLTGLRLLPVYS
jgi:hypothetical protein